MTVRQAGEARGDRIAAIASWLAEAALGAPGMAATLAEFGTRLMAAGIPVARGYVTYTTLHPLYRGGSVTWRSVGGVEAELFRHETPEPDAWISSPVAHLFQTGLIRSHWRLGQTTEHFPVFDDLGAAGYTDYLCEVTEFVGYHHGVRQGWQEDGKPETGMALSWSSRQQGGFTPDEAAILFGLMRPFAIVTKVAIQQSIAESLAECYIGREAGLRVLNGAIQRGDVAARDAVVWLSDLRDSTRMAQSMDLSSYITTLNAFFDSTASMVEAEGGEIVTYIGDGALGIFPIETLGAEGARAAALRAARRAQQAVATLNTSREAAGTPALRAGVALHAGLLGYGNIGVPSRQAWSVVGPVVNETARLEGLTKTLGVPIIASASFARGLDTPWRSLGSHDLRGVSDQIEAFAPEDEVDARSL